MVRDIVISLGLVNKQMSPLGLYSVAKCPIVIGNVLQMARLRPCGR